MRAGRTRARGKQGSAAKWAHSAIALAARSLEPAQAEAQTNGTPPNGALRARASATDKTPPASHRPDPQRVMTMVRRLLREGDARQGETGAGGTVSPQDARCLLRAWLTAVELDHLDTDGLIAHMQEESFSHSDLYRRACRLHERKLRGAVELALGAARGESEVLAAAEGVFEACIAAIPYAPATAFLAGEQTKLARLPFGVSGASGGDDGDGETPRVAILADGIGSTHGVTRTIEEIRARGVPGYRDRGARHRPRGGPAAVGGRGDRRALLPGFADRSAEPARRGADDHRRRLRRDPRVLARSGWAWRGRCSRGRWGCR